MQYKDGLLLKSVFVRFIAGTRPFICSSLLSLSGLCNNGDVVLMLLNRTPRSVRPAAGVGSSSAIRASASGTQQAAAENGSVVDDEDFDDSASSSQHD